MQGKKKDLVNLYISCIETIANGRLNELVFEGEDMSFFRGEIHIIKVIGDEPGIISLDIAKKMNVTKAVISKTLTKLEQRGFIEKREDEEDRKKKQLFLTERGKEAYGFHEAYHEIHDKDFFDFIKKLNDKETELIFAFLKEAKEMISHHF